VGTEGRPLAVFDLDGTITRTDTLAPFLLRCLARRPWRLARLPLVVPAAVRYLFDHDRGALKGALLRATLGGLSRGWLEQRSAAFVQGLLSLGLFDEARIAIETHRSRGDRLLLMSASTDLYVPQIADQLGFEQVLCSRVRWRADGRLDGRLDGPNCRGAEKQRQLQELIERDHPARVYAYGNSAADLAHMRLAHEAFLVNGPRRLPIPVAVQRLRWSQASRAVQ